MGLTDGILTGKHLQLSLLVVGLVEAFALLAEVEKLVVFRCQFLDNRHIINLIIGPFSYSKNISSIFIIHTQFTQTLQILSLQTHAQTLQQSTLKPQITITISITSVFITHQNLIHTNLLKMNHRELNLQNIIKQQQAKIAQLKEELSLVAKITQTSFLDSEKRNIQLSIQKDDIIVHLKNQLDTLRGKYSGYDGLLEQNERLQTEIAQLQDEYAKSKEQTTQLNQKSANQQKRIRQLQYKLQTKVQEYEKKVTGLQRQSKRLSAQLENINQTFTFTQTQIDKLTKFYKTSTFDIPKRKETLLWVDNLIKYMEVNESSSQKKYLELFDFVKGTLTEMQKEVMKAVSEVAVLEEGLVKEGQRVLFDMRKVCEEMKGKDAEIGYGIDELIKTGKKQKQTAEKNQLQTTRHQLQLIQQQSCETITQLKSRIKQLQAQKKTLVLGFQQIKTFLENRETNFKEQINSLKHTINELLEANELRQREFEEEIKMLSSQIEAISMRYYENIEYPVMRVNEKVERELNSVKHELLKLTQESSFREELISLATRLKVYGEAVTDEDKEFQAIELCMKKGNQLMITIRQLLIEIGEKKSEKLSQPRSQPSVIVQPSVIKPLSYKSKTPNKQIFTPGPASIPRYPANEVSFNESNVISCHFEYENSELDELRELQSAVSQIQLKERESKLTYEISLLKKHNQKLTDHLSALEKKFKLLAGNKIYDDKTMSAYFLTERKLVELQAELEQAKEANLEYERIIKEEVGKFINKFEQFKKEFRTTNKEEAAILQALNQLNERHAIIFELMTTRNSRIAELQQSTIAINKMLLKPSETFESLVKQFTSQLSSLTSIHNHHASRVNPQNFSSNNYSHSCRSRLSINESTIKEYQEILARRSEINSSGAKYIIELIKTIRETFPVRDNKRKQDAILGEKENLMKGPLNQSKSNSKVSNFEKKIKQIITAQQKYKQQITTKIDKLFELLNLIDTKRQKQTKLSSGKQKKIQQLLQKHLHTSTNEIKVMIERQTREHIGLNTQALRDTASKLRESIKENEGLKREMDTLLAVGKNLNQSQGQQNNFYEQA